MKLRIKGNSIRLRLTQTEVRVFGTKGTVEEIVDFGKPPRFCYVVQKNSTKEIRASFDDGKIEVSVPNDVAEKWVSSDQVGIEGADGDLQILIEKDFACIKARKGEDESDNFPHPDEKSC